MADTKQQAHELIERLPPTQLSAVVGLLEAMLDPSPLQPHLWKRKKSPPKRPRRWTAPAPRSLAVKAFRMKKS